MALDPYQRISRRNGLSGNDKPPNGSRVPWLIGVVGLIAMLAIVYQLSVMGISSRTLQDFGWYGEPPP
jgi:hypothetical protein